MSSQTEPARTPRGHKIFPNRREGRVSGDVQREERDPRGARSSDRNPLRYPSSSITFRARIDAPSVLQLRSHTSPSSECVHTETNPGLSTLSAATPPGSAMTLAAGNTCAPKSHAPIKMNTAERLSSFVAVMMYADVTHCHINGDSASGHARVVQESQ